jgi:hypothetical protein
MGTIQIVSKEMHATVSYRSFGIIDLPMTTGVLHGWNFVQVNLVR